MIKIITTLLANKSFQKKVQFNTRRFSANEKILLQGEMHHCLYLIKIGRVRIRINTDINDTLQLRPGVADLGPNDIFGEFGLFDDLPASADAETIVESELLEIDAPSFKQFLDDNPPIAYTIYLEMLKTLVKRLRSADKTIYSFYSWGVKAYKPECI